MAQSFHFSVSTHLRCIEFQAGSLQRKCPALSLHGFAQAIPFLFGSKKSPNQTNTNNNKKKNKPKNTQKTPLGHWLKDRTWLFFPDHHFGQTFPRLWRAAFSLLLTLVQLHQQCLESCREKAFKGEMPFPSQKQPAHEHRHFLVNRSSLLPASATRVASDSSLPPETAPRFAQLL